MKELTASAVEFSGFFSRAFSAYSFASPIVCRGSSVRRSKARVLRTQARSDITISGLVRSSKLARFSSARLSLSPEKLKISENESLGVPPSSAAASTDRMTARQICAAHSCISRVRSLIFQLKRRVQRTRVLGTCFNLTRRINASPCRAAADSKQITESVISTELESVSMGRRSNNLPTASPTIISPSTRASISALTVSMTCNFGSL